ncbi:MAG: ABC transporter ATP-binding protein, partial [Thermoleophilia bacterium]|nr:ABC transporter ATP-binding protein [Thermoleophilia bacterium]
MLKLEGIEAWYGSIQALKGVDLEVHEGEIVSLIGSNGAGKTTTMKTIHGLMRPKAGRMDFLGRDATKLSTQELVRLGMAQSPEGRRVFPKMTVLENLEMGAFQRTDTADIARDIDHVYELFPRLLERREQQAGLMSGGEQQMLAMGRALMARPRLLLLDEPSMGLAPLVIQQIFDIIVSINQTGTTVLLVEQNANVALSISHRAYVLETGRVTLHGTGAELLASDAVRKA